MKAAYFPLKEIRRRLAGLGDDEVRALLAAADTSPEDVVATGTADASLAGAREYLALLESRATYRAEPLTLPFVTPPIAAQPATQLQSEDFHVDAEWSPDDAAESPASPVRVAHEAAPPPEPALWRRLPLGDEAELVISDRAYSRHRERIDWLVRWARKVFA